MNQPPYYRLNSRSMAERFLLIAASILGTHLAVPMAAWSQEPPETDRPAVTSDGVTLDGTTASEANGNAQPASKEQSVEYWVSQLGHDQYYRRELASKKLIAAGASAVGPLADALRAGDLEVVERAAAALVEIAIGSAPRSDGGAYDRLSVIGAQSAGRAASVARGAMREIRSFRHSQANEALVAAGVFVGEKEFIVSAISQMRMTVEVDEKWNGDLEALQWIEWLEGIDSARVSGPAITLEVIQSVIRLPGLRSIAIVDGTLQDGILEAISAMDRLENLDLRYVRMNDPQADLIANIPLRDSLNLMGTSISQERVDTLREKLPGLRIDHRRGAFLGVKCSDDNNECELQTVVSGGAAEAAGLRTGDVIVQIDDDKIDTFKDLQRIINQHIQGDEVEVHYRRGLKTERVKIQLGRLNES